ncbi:MAG: hypothetical protein MUF59_01980 [Candidatus Krumholzibacteria bacterium]|jgi:hypothetical protein|nr:hypothetical protein [Candidatus Krumholzibacteria bacterium]
MEKILSAAERPENPPKEAGEPVKTAEFHQYVEYGNWQDPIYSGVFERVNEN